MLDVNLKVPLSTITNGIRRLSKSATTAIEKNNLFRYTEALGTAITTQHTEFNVNEFMKECGVDPAWVKAA